MKLCVKCFKPFEGGEYDKFDYAKVCADCAYKALMAFCDIKPNNEKVDNDQGYGNSIY